MGGGGANDDKWAQLARRYARVRLKLYKKPKPGGASPQLPEGIDTLSDEGKKGDRISSRSHTERGSKASAKMMLIGAVILLVVILVYVFYTPSPPPVGNAADAASLVPLCQQGNGTACAMAALLRWEGKDHLNGSPGVSDKNAAFAYARIACGRGSPFGCFLLWRLWAHKEVLLIKPLDAEKALRRGCEEESAFCCHLLSRFSGRKEVSENEWKDAVDAFLAAGKKRYAERNEEQRLFERFIASLKGE